uniref:Uncharacterized protein n=1 Tax=Anguilla anguilla TaxID=7936 RepID=A0A0E9SB77_ANGAN
MALGSAKYCERRSVVSLSGHLPDQVHGLCQAE